MRTRSKASSETVDREEEEAAAKRKRKDDDPAVDYAESRSKRWKTQVCAEVASASQSMASRAKSPRKTKGHNSADPEIPAKGLSASSTSKNGDDEAFAMTLGKFVGAVQKRGAADKSSQKPTGEKSCASLKKSITRKQGTIVSPVLIQILDDRRGRDNENSTEGGAREQCCSSLLLNTGVKHCSRDDVTPTQGDSIEQCSSGFKRNVHTPGVSTHYGQDGLQIVDSPVSPQEVDCTQCQLHEDGYHLVADADATFVKGKTEKCLRHNKRGASLGGCFTTSSKRRLEEQPLSCPRSGKSKGHPGYIKRFKNQRKKSIGTMRTQVSQEVNSCSQKRLNAAKSRWKNLAQSILSAKISPERLASSSEDLVKHHVLSSESAPVNDHSHRLTDVPGANWKHNKTLSRPKNQRKRSAAANASTVARRPVTGRMQQNVRKKQLSLLKRMKTWLTEAKFSQGPKEKNNNDIGEEFLMTEDERFAFAQTMVQSCQENPNMRKAFLESMRMLTSSGLMQAAASNLLLQGPCEEAQNVVNAWAEFKEQNAITKTLPMNLLNAVNQLHEKSGDLLTKLSTPNIVGICTLSQIDEKTWKFQLPLEDFLLPRNIGQDTTV